MTRVLIQHCLISNSFLNCSNINLSIDVVWTGTHFKFLKNCQQVMQLLNPQLSQNAAYPLTTMISLQKCDNDFIKRAH